MPVATIVNPSSAFFTLDAFNTAAASANKIHDDATAKRFGFTGALVPGVEVYAYMTRAALAHFGPNWLARGTMSCRFASPVYHGHRVMIVAHEKNGDLDIVLRDGEIVCATGTASMLQNDAVVASHYARAVPAQDDRPAASTESLREGGTLSIHPVRIDKVMLSNYLGDVREHNPLYACDGIVHPGQILRLANAALVDNVVLGPWIHVGSAIRNHHAARAGETLTLDSTITANHVQKGHAIVVFDAVVRADDAPVATITHTSIWRPRQVAEAG